MRRPLQLTVCLLGGLALAVSGCGGSSAKKGTTATTTTVASAPTGITAPATTPSASGGSTAPGTGATGPRVGSTGPSGGATGKQTSAEAAKAAEAELLRKKHAAERRIAQIRARYRSEGAAEKKAQLEAAKRAVRKKHKPYPEYLQAQFTATCEAAQGSASQCACILSKQEFSSVEAALSLGELLALEQALKATTIQDVARPLPPRSPVALPEGVRTHLEQCLGGK